MWSIAKIESSSILKQNEIIRCQWLDPIILATQEAEIKRIAVASLLGQIVYKILSQKIPSQKRVGRVTQSVSPEFKPQYYKKKKKGMKSCHLGQHG
jgi:hypothetical protein